MIITNSIPRTTISLLTLIMWFPGIKAFQPHSLKHQQIMTMCLLVTNPPTTTQTTYTHNSPNAQFDKNQVAISLNDSTF
jgi:hypothetical protein